MKTINNIFISGQFVTPTGEETMMIVNPANEEILGMVQLGNEQDILDAIESAKRALPSFSQTTKVQRMQYLQDLHDSIMERIDDLQQATIDEYGATVERALWSNRYAAEIFLNFKKVLEDFEFDRTVGTSLLTLVPVGVAAILTSWNSNSGSICVKLAAAIAAGCTTVIKPSELSAIQSQILAECFEKAGLPEGVINMVQGKGDVLGPVISKHPDVSKILFTGSTAVGKIIARSSADTMKRLTLELSGKSPNIILDDADLEKAVPMAVNACFMNNGQACIAGSRLIVPAKLLPEIKKLLIREVESLRIGDPHDEKTLIGPLANKKQFDRMQHYIRSGIDEGAELLVGGLGKPENMQKGYFVKPTVFTRVTPEMTIAREEIFGPILSVITYNSDEEAVRIANDTVYGLQAYISSSDSERAEKIARKINAGRVLINTLYHDPFAPFGGFRESGIGREGGVYGLEEMLELKVIIN
ncbi:aldehyde dehydrogenase family protein [Chryseobacterium gossypii]|uniref:aldehyde dehydrogenase family protein n=1 Tax=Chryseobacterium gossypii TaxID=3231602 RepID=UPI003524EE03